MIRTRTVIVVVVSALILILATWPGLAQDSAPQAALGTAFTYQGRLQDGSGPVSNTCDFQFKLFNAATDGTQIDGTQTLTGVQVSEGLFTVQLDFGASAFNGYPRWLEIAVRCPTASGSYVTLSPRQALTPAPYALYAAATGGGDGGGSGWALTGNSGTTPGTNYLGTSDSKALELKVNGGRALRLEPNGTSPNVIGGHGGNEATTGKVGATISGGGSNGHANRIAGNYAAVGGGLSNTAGADSATVAGGFGNEVSAVLGTIGGGGRTNFGSAATANRVTDEYGTVSGGGYNQAGDADNDKDDASYATVGGGWHNVASGQGATVAGGGGNVASSIHATVGGGWYNEASAWYATIAGGGPSDPISNPQTTGNRVTDRYGTVGGGGDNQAGDATGDTTTAQYATVAGGLGNTASRDRSTIGGGESNVSSGRFGTVAGGTYNVASGSGATVAGGELNRATDYHAAVGGGSGNVASGRWATVPGGSANKAAGDNSFAAGSSAVANNPGCFVWSDSNYTGQLVTCNVDHRWVARASGGVYFYTNGALTSGVKVDGGGNAWSSVSARALKQNFETVDTVALVERLAKEVPVTTWNYKSEDPSIRHMGPVAEDFYAAFGLGDDGQYISTIDADGVALAAIQGLYLLLQERDDQIADLEARVAALEALVMAEAGTAEGGQP